MVVKDPIHVPPIVRARSTGAMVERRGRERKGEMLGFTRVVGMQTGKRRERERESESK